MVGNANESLSTCDSSRVADRPRNPFSLMGDRQQVAIIAGPAIEHVQPREQPELARTISQSVRDLQAAPEGTLGLLAVALGEHESVSERRLQLELPPAAQVRVVEHRERAAGPE